MLSDSTCRGHALQYGVLPPRYFINPQYSENYSLIQIQTLIVLFLSTSRFPKHVKSTSIRRADDPCFPLLFKIVLCFTYRNLRYMYFLDSVFINTEIKTDQLKDF